jgi:hypothetical protein
LERDPQGSKKLKIVLDGTVSAKVTSEIEKAFQPIKLASFGYDYPAYWTQIKELMSCPNHIMKFPVLKGS